MSETEEFDGSGTMILAPNELRVGMYVSYLDRPWTETPFPFQGFRIQSEAELQKLKNTCEYVFVNSDNSGKDYEAYFAERTRRMAGEKTGLWSKPDPAPDNAVEISPTEKEFPQAKAAHKQMRRVMIECYQEASKGNRPDLLALQDAADQVVASVRRSPDALLYFVRAQASGDYIYRHGVACAVMLAALGLAMGKGDKALRTLTMGGALLDIGKMRVPSDLLNRPRASELSSAELHQLRRHVDLGVEVISQVLGENSPIRNMIYSHHERFDGTGYPDKLTGDQTTQFAQMAAIVDMFDAMVSERSYGRRATPYEAMRYIVGQKGKSFDPGLVQVFRDTFGTYPTGSLVELSTGHVGYVLQQTRSRLQPRVYVLLDPAKSRLSEFQVLDLHSSKSGVCIEGCLKPGSYGIDY